VTEPPVPSAGPASLTYLDAAEKVLDETPARKPISYRTITARAIAEHYLISSGLTPESTMFVQLATDVKRRAGRGDEPRFTQLPGGLFGLAKWREDDLVTLIGRHNRAVKAQLLVDVKKMDPTPFEVLIGILMARIGFDVQVTKPTADGGIDLTGQLVIGGVIETHMAVQVKRWVHNVQAPTVQQVRGALGAHDQGLIITTSDFSKGARAEASQIDRTPVALMNGNDLVSLLAEHQIGIRRANPDLLELDELPGSAPELGEPAAEAG
jgi:restriction system protein